ncbi:hypothetical protein [uncultured Oscillibacter sp.]|uniref:hypothetical protein n=1 Tax=uncultured Oscillibacter sp. TaxID=876091 RepID=UPI0025F269A5|nr:hypothetical protein [uncultured Oscillibacter sp.]
MMIKKRCLILEAPYALIVTAYLLALNGLNHRLLSLSAQNEAISPFELLSYHNYEPLYFFFIAVVLTISGVALSIYHLHQIRYMELEYEELLATLLSILINILLIILLFVFINNPILRAIICVVFIVIGGLGLSQD